MDRGYVDFSRLYILHLTGPFFITRAKSNMDAHRIYSSPTDRSTGIICNQTIALDGFYTKKDYPQHLRRIRFKDLKTHKTLVFLTNNFTLPSPTICALYKNRWQVEIYQAYCLHKSVFKKLTYFIAGLVYPDTLGHALFA
mgnify:CR=1 FL=1